VSLLEQWTFTRVKNPLDLEWALVEAVWLLGHPAPGPDELGDGFQRKDGFQSQGDQGGQEAGLGSCAARVKKAARAGAKGLRRQLIERFGGHPGRAIENPVGRGS